MTSLSLVRFTYLTGKMSIPSRRLLNWKRMEIVGRSLEEHHNCQFTCNPSHPLLLLFTSILLFFNVTFFTRTIFLCFDSKIQTNEVTPNRLNPLKIWPSSKYPASEGRQSLHRSRQFGVQGVLGTCTTRFACI